MALVIEETVKYLKKTPTTILGSAVWEKVHRRHSARVGDISL